MAKDQTLSEAVAQFDKLVKDAQKKFDDAILDTDDWVRYKEELRVLKNQYANAKIQAAPDNPVKKDPTDTSWQSLGPKPGETVVTVPKDKVAVFEDKSPTDAEKAEADRLEAERVARLEPKPAVKF